MVQKYSIFAAIQANDVMRNAYLINLVRVLCGLPVSGDSTENDRSCVTTMMAPLLKWVGVASGWG